MTNDDIVDDLIHMVYQSPVCCRYLRQTAHEREFVLLLFTHSVRAYRDVATATHLQFQLAKAPAKMLADYPDLRAEVVRIMQDGLLALVLNFEDGTCSVALDPRNIPLPEGAEVN